MNVEPSLTQTLASRVPAGNLFIARNASGMPVTYLRVADGEATSRHLQSRMGMGTVAVVQMSPLPTDINWMTAIEDGMVSDLTAALVVRYDPTPSNIRYINDTTSLTAGDLVVAGGHTWLVFLAPNPAIGLGLVDTITLFVSRYSSSASTPSSRPKPDCL